MLRVIQHTVETVYLLGDNNTLQLEQQKTLYRFRLRELERHSGDSGGHQLARVRPENKTHRIAPSIARAFDEKRA